MTFTTVINCIDGRVQLPVNEYMRLHTHADFVDTITEPGPVLILAEDPLSGRAESILARVATSMRVHDTQCIGLVAHYDCRANPQPYDTQKQQLDTSVRFLAGHFPYTEILGLWVDTDSAVRELFRLNP